MKQSDILSQINSALDTEFVKFAYVKQVPTKLIEISTIGDAKVVYNPRSGRHFLVDTKGTYAELKTKRYWW